MLKECVVKVVNSSGNENCWQDNFRLERTRSDTPGYMGQRFAQALGNREQSCQRGTLTQSHQSRNWPDEEFTRTYKELKNFQDGRGVVNFVFFFVVEVSHPGSSDYRVCHGSVHTLTCCTHIFLHIARAQSHDAHCVCAHSAHLHACEHTRMAQVSEKFCCMRMSHISISCVTLRPCCSLTVTSRPLSRLWRPRLPCRALPDPKARVKRTSARAPRSLATWPCLVLTQVMSPNSSTRSLL